MPDEYITKQDAIRKAKMANHDTNHGGVDWEQDERTEYYINELPAADVRPVVLCCYCEHYKRSIGCGWCEVAGRSTYDDFFCASGRWKSNGAYMREVDDG